MCSSAFGLSFVFWKFYANLNYIKNEEEKKANKASYIYAKGLFKVKF